MQPDDNPPVGLLLCTGKGDTLVKYATAGLDQNIFVQKYMINLPSVEDLTSYIEKETEKEIGRLSSAKWKAKTKPVDSLNSTFTQNCGGGGSAPAVRHHLPNRSADVIVRHDEFKKVLLIYQYLPSVVFL